jgi:hypothetical protein
LDQELKEMRDSNREKENMEGSNVMFDADMLTDCRGIDDNSNHSCQQDK